jgi:hypothetical protein
VAKLTIYKYVRTGKGWRYCKAAFHPNGKIKPNAVVVSGVEEKHTEGRYFLNFNNEWIDVAILRDMRLCMTQNALDDLLIRAQFIQVRSDATPEAVPSVPVDLETFDDGTDDSLSSLSKSMC